MDPPGFAGGAYRSNKPSYCSGNGTSLRGSNSNSGCCMPTLGRIRAGHKARTVGSSFEEMIARAAARLNITAIKIPDSCRTIRGPRGIDLQRIRSPFDYVLLKGSIAVTLDAKTVEGSTFPYSSLCPYQLQSLALCGRDAFRSGYLIWFRSSDLITFHSISRLRMLQKRDSLRPTGDCMPIGTSGGLNLDRLFRHDPLTKGGVTPTE